MNLENVVLHENNQAPKNMVRLHFSEILGDTQLTCGVTIRPVEAQGRWGRLGRDERGPSGAIMFSLDMHLSKLLQLKDLNALAVCCI